MKKNQNDPTDIAEHSIIRQARILNNEIEPETDLWPAIADRIRELPQQEVDQPRTNHWMPVALAATVLIAISALSFVGYSNYALQQQVHMTAFNESTIDLIEQPYLAARTSYLTTLATEEQQMSPEVREVLKKNLKIIDNATREIRLALAENPNDPFLTAALLQTRQKELELLNQVTYRGQDTI